MSSKHPLDDTFDIHRERLIDEDEKSVTIPTDKELHDLGLIIELALNAYEEQMNDVQFIEPKNRIRYLEVAERFLNQAKDAIAKRDKLVLDRERLEKGTKKASTGSTRDDGEEDEPQGTVSRTELQKRMKRVK